MIAVKFINGYSPYQAGEIAGFSDKYAKKLIKAGIAIPYVTEMKEKQSYENKMVEPKETKNMQKRKRGQRKKEGENE